MKRIFSILLWIGLFIIPFTADAGIFGILKGKIKDTDGKPLPGAVVRVQGTNRGSNAKVDGSYQIAQLTSGKYEIQVTFASKDTMKLSVTISADRTTEQDIIMGEKTVRTIIVETNKVNMTTTGSGGEFRSGDITAQAGGNVFSIIATSPGIVASGSGFEIRGSRANESSSRVDGIDISNQFSGGVGVTGTAYYPSASAFATEEVQVLTGGFGAEYGEVTGGITNSVIKTGKTDKFEGFLYYNTDLPSLNGSQASGLKVEKQNTDIKAIETGPGAKLQGKGVNNIEYGFGGYIPGVKGMTFYLSGVNKTEKINGASYKIFDPLGNNLGQIANDGVWVKSITARLKYSINDDIDLVLGTNFGLTSVENSSWGWLYANQPGIINGVSNGIAESFAKQSVTNQVANSYFARINHRLDDENNYELKFSYSVNNDETGRRIGADGPSYFKGFNIYQPEDKIGALPTGKVDNKKNGAMDIYEAFYGESTYYVDSLTKEPIRGLPIRNPLTGYYEGVTISNGTNNAYGIENRFVSHGNGGGFQFREGAIMQLDGFYEKTINQSDFKHLIKTGFEARTYQMHRYLNGNPENSAPTSYDIYTDHRGGNGSITASQAVVDLTSKPKTPFRASVYVQDQLSSKNSSILFTPGLRVDYFNPNDNYRINNDRFYSVEETQFFAKATAKVYIAPRMNVTYPITQSSNILINYGVYYKMPDLQSMYDYSNTTILYGASTVGNPNIKAQKTNQYNLQYKNQLNQDFVFTASVYYNDIFNQLGYAYVPAVPQPYFVTAITEYGNNKGVEFEIRKYERDNFGFRLNYTLAFANGTASAAGSNVGANRDPFTGQYAIPLAEAPLSRDVRHRINYVLNLYSQDGEGPNIAGTHPLENMQLNISGGFASGSPYTKFLVGSSVAAGSINGERNPSTLSSNIRLAKTFLLKDVLGDMAAASTFDIYVDVFNWMNFTSYTSVNPATGNPIDDGVALHQQIGSFIATPYYKEGTPGVTESLASGQYDTYGQRFYNANSDFDKNGVLTLAERYTSYLKYVEDVLSFKGRYQAPRQVSIGLLFRF